MKNKFTFQENWYFIKQDIVSYTLSTFVYLSLCLIRDFSLQSAIYALFECLVFYVPFWIIRMSFADTYHSDVWAKCKLWTRLMLCSGAFVLWILPVKYSLFNCLFVSFMCCLILYLCALDKNEKILLKKRIEESENKNIYDMTDEEFVAYCKHKGLSEQDTMIAECIYRKHLKGSVLYQAIGYSKAQTIRIRKKIKKILGI